MKPLILDEPDVPLEQQGQAELGMRYEDVCQDGRLRIDGVWPPMGRILWSDARLGAPFARLGERGIRSVLARVVIHAEDVPVSPRVRVLNRVRYQLGHTLDAHGDVGRIVLDTWLSTEGKPARSVDGSRVLIARAYGQHVFTKPGAPKGEHRVLRLDDPALPAVPETRVELPPASGLLEAPDGARFIDGEPRPDTAPLVFGLSHTDLNQHVNFLTYPRCVEDAALRRFAELEPGRRLLGRSIELFYLKPCFAGERVRIVLRAFSMGGRVGVCAVFVPDADFTGAAAWQGFGRARCVARLWLAE
jgi:hypothetical protein